MTKYVLTALACLLLGGSFATPGNAADLERLERPSLREPRYVSKNPLYGLLVFGPEAAFRAWAVLDQSDPAKGTYDVLYFDFEGKGDLTRDEHKFVMQKGQGSWTLASLRDPHTDQTHKDLSISVRPRGGDHAPNVMIRLKWRGTNVIMGGGYPEVASDEYMPFGKDPKIAPVIWFNCDGDFRFQRWIVEPLKIGGETDFKVFLGQKGLGKHTFTAIMHPFLPESVPVLATLLYEDVAGKRHEVDLKLPERC